MDIGLQAAHVQEHWVNTDATWVLHVCLILTTHVQSLLWFRLNKAHGLKKPDGPDRLLNNIGKDRAALTMETTRSQQDRIVPQITLTFNGTILRGEERAASTYTGAETLDSMVCRFNGRMYKSEQVKKSKKSAIIRDSEAAAISQHENSSIESDSLALMKGFIMKLMPLN